jgi:hypothetical protein
MATAQKMGDRSQTKVLDRAAFRIRPKVCLRRASNALWLDEDQRVKIW